VDHFGEDVAARYDSADPEVFADDVVVPTVDLLAGLAGDGAALELGVGTGRIALPLSARGVPVHGVDLSAAMLARLRAKPGAERVAVTEGDLAHVRVPGRFRLVYLVFNTVMNLTSQDEQVACFATAAAHLEPGGCFVVEVMVPDLQRLPFGERFRPFTVTDHHLGVDEYDVVTQGLVSHHHSRVDGAWRLTSVPFRYVWPAELDLMARLAGLRLRDRWADWRRTPFTATSTGHVSVWEKPA
jgi:hypothetical protein